MKKIIVDASIAHKCCKTDDAGTLVLKGLLSGELVLCSSIGYLGEIKRTTLATIYSELILAGLVSFYNEEKMKDAREAIAKCKLSSNDAEILALAHASICRLLFTADKPLMNDFTSLEILPSPKGKVFQNKSHAHLLK
jgi:predicted nucleic acid-binding protein